MANTQKAAIARAALVKSTKPDGAKVFRAVADMPNLTDDVMRVAKTLRVLVEADTEERFADTLYLLASALELSCKALDEKQSEAFRYSRGFVYS